MQKGPERRYAARSRGKVRDSDAHESTGPLTSMVSWKLTIEDDEGQKALMPLVGNEYTLGRDSQNAVHLPERNISRKHATLKLNGEARWHLVDHDSGV